ncbi:hypothetical protein DFH07DRAFT_871112 [Mycena maculata]|uniref:Enoyl reductase (ER) domain-containing protein n=1 Tax=Mycena maculata TaxID=230809 RepID=A0AAD7HZE7_9AGAR|nr:hypothetical protein DFH07DRAFT_871112 [Mycena maculata]
MSLPTTRQYCFPELGSLQNLTLQEVPVGAPKVNEVLVKTHAVALQPRMHYLLHSVQYSLILMESLPSPLVPTADMAGEVVAVGQDVTLWKKGDRVLNKNGAPTEYRIFPADALFAMPDHLSYEEASTLPSSALTAYNALLGGIEPLKAGDTILVQGTGGVSMRVSFFGLQFAVATGATVIATSSSDEKLKAAAKLGAKHVINYRTTLNWGEEVLKLTNGAGVDQVIEHTPPDVIMPSIHKELNTRGIWIGSAAQCVGMCKLISANPGTTRPIIDKVFAFDEAKQALPYLESQAHVGKVVIKVC